MRRSDDSGPILSVLAMGPESSDRRIRKDDVVVVWLCIYLRALP